MIDTDKYEGHPPAPWGWRHKVAEWRLTANGDKEWIDGIRVNEDTDLTAMALIADAPLLLQEVKRLREQGRKLIEAAERVRSDISDQDTGWYYQLGNHIEKMNRLVKE